LIEQTIFLWGLPLLLLPWILRLIKTQKPTLVEFSQSYLLKKVIDAYKPKQRKNPWWLILIRVLLLFTLILLIAGLLLPQKRSRGPMSLVLLLDDSLYSRSFNHDRHTIWDETVNQAISSLTEFSIQTKVAIVTSTGYSSNWQPISQALLQLKSQKASYQEEHWNRVKGQLQKLLRQREHDDLQLIYIGDGKSTQPEGLTNSLNQWPDDKMDFVYLDNPISANFSISGSAKARSEGTLLEFYLNGPSEESSIELEVLNPNGKSEKKAFYWKGKPTYSKWELKGQDWKHGKLSININDQYDFDNQFYFNIEESSHQQLILLQHQQAEKRLQDSGYYLEKALVNLAQQHRLEFRSISPRSWQSLSGGKGDLLILHDPPFLSKTESDKIIQFIRRGGKALIMPGPLTSAEALHTSLGDLLPGKLKEQSRKKLKLELPEDWKLKIPRLATSTLRGNWLFYQLHPESQIIMRLEDGSPFWMKRDLTKGELHLMSSPFHISYSDALVQNDILDLLNLITNSSKHSDSIDTKLSAGLPAPNEIESILPLFASHNFDHQFVTPGIYEVQKSGQKVIQSCNAPILLNNERLPFSDKINSNRTAHSFSMSPTRIDVEIAILFFFLLLLEIFSLYQLQKPKVSKSSF